MIAHYCFDGDAKDRLGTKDGTVYGATLTADRKGNSNSAYYFDGINDYIQLPKAVWMSGNFSITGWLRVDAQKHFGRFFEFGNGTTWGNNVVYAPTSGVTTIDAYHVHPDSCGPGNTYNYTGAPTFPKKIWVFVSIVQRGTDGEIWRNGKNATTVKNPIIPPCSVMRNQCYFGKSIWSTDEYFEGAMDDIRIYNRALDSLEIDSLYNNYQLCNQPSAITEQNMANPELGQNYPNPFSNQTSIDYSLPQGTKGAVMSICDISVREVVRIPVAENKGTSISKQTG